jgi:hypothetical protein
MPQQTIVGASVVCYINGRSYGQVKSFRWSPTTPQREIHGLDSVEAYDFMPQAVSVQGDIGVWRTRLDGGAQGAGAGFAFADIPHAMFFTVQLKEVVTQTLIFEARYCSVVNENWGAEAGGVVQGSMTFKGLSYRNEILRPDQG